MVIHTLIGDMFASRNDYIIKGLNGEFYPCKPDIFQKKYIPANAEDTNKERECSEPVFFSYDNFEGDKGIIIADFYDTAAKIYKKEYLNRKIAKNHNDYYDHGCFF